MHHGELRAAADKMRDLLARIEAIEGAKQQLTAGSDAFVELAVEADRLSGLIKLWSEHQLQLAQSAARELTPGDHVKLRDVEPRQLDRILTDWREAEMRLQSAQPNSSEAALAASDADRLRAEYRAAEQQKHHGRGSGDDL